MKANRCPTCGRKHKRSSAANSRYWLLLHVIAEKLLGGRHSAESWHLWAKSRFLGCDEIQLPDGKALLIPKSSAALDTAEFSEYMEKLEAWAGEHGVWLDDVSEAA